MHNSETVLSSLSLFLIAWAIGGYLVFRGIEWLARLIYRRFKS